MNLLNRFIHFFNLSFGVGLIVLVSLTIGRVYFTGVTGLDFIDSSVASESIRTPSQESETNNLELENSENDNNGATQSDTEILGNVGLSSEQMAEVAKNIYHVAMSMSDDFVVSDALTLTMYVLSSMAEIGEYDLAQKDILILITAFENLAQMEVGHEVRDIITQIKKIRFGRKNGLLFAQIFARHPDLGVEIPINDYSPEADSSVEEIVKVVIENGSTLSFEQITKTEQIRKAKSFIKDPVQLLGGFESLVDELNQIHPVIENNIDHYFMRDDLKAPALWINMSGVSVHVDTSTVFDKMKFEFVNAVALPNIGNEEGRIPSFILSAKAKLLNLKVSVDQ